MLLQYRNFIIIFFIGIIIISYYSIDKIDSPHIIFKTFDLKPEKLKKYFNSYKNSNSLKKCPSLNSKIFKLFKELTTPNVFVTEAERSKLSIKDIGFVTFTSQSHVHEALVNCKSIQAHPELKLVPLTIFITEDVTENNIKNMEKACPKTTTKIIKFPFKLFPKNLEIETLDNYRFKALHQTMALKNHKVLLSFDTSIMFRKDVNLTDIIQSSIKTNPTDVTLLSGTRHNMFAATHPKMYDCFPKINSTDMTKVTQFQSGLILWIGSKNGWKTMRRYVECSLKPTCLAPIGATKKCNMRKIFNDPKHFSGCHRFDQSAINLILYENSNFNQSLYQTRSPYFSVHRRNG